MRLSLLAKSFSSEVSLLLFKYVFSVLNTRLAMSCTGFREWTETFKSGLRPVSSTTPSLWMIMNCSWAPRNAFCPSLRRPCAMVVPDFELICEIMLVAEGFIEARVLARKFITLYTLCKELLSKQVLSAFFNVTHQIRSKNSRYISTSKLSNWHDVLFVFWAFDEEWLWGSTQEQTSLSDVLHLNKRLQRVWMLFHPDFSLLFFQSCFMCLAVILTI